MNTPRTRCQAGAALLMAMLTVTLVATFAAAALWQQWRSVEVETAERARVQSAWLLTGAFDWSRLILREDKTPDYLGEPWAVPLQEARLSSFLAADRNSGAETGPDVLEAFLSGQMTDMQSFLNVTNLLDPGGTISANGLRSFGRLFELLGLPPAQLERMAENLRFASDKGLSNASAAMAPLVPQRVEQLVWLGLPAQTVAVLQPYITILPTRTNVNLNTASAEVIYAASVSLSLAEAQRLVAVRDSAHFRNREDAAQLVTPNALQPGKAEVDVSSEYFEARARLRLDQLVVEERALLHRVRTAVTTLQRERRIVDATGVPQAVSNR